MRAGTRGKMGVYSTIERKPRSDSLWGQQSVSDRFQYLVLSLSARPGVGPGPVAQGGLRLRGGGDARAGPGPGRLHPSGRVELRGQRHAHGRCAAAAAAAIRIYPSLVCSSWHYWVARAEEGAAGGCSGAELGLGGGQRTFRPRVVWMERVWAKECPLSGCRVA
jgi:hypothetical protein